MRGTSRLGSPNAARHPPRSTCSNPLPAACSRRNPVLREVREDGLMRFPTVRELHRDAEVHRIGVRMRVKQLRDACTRDDDARVAMPRQQHAQPAGLQMERCSVAAP